MICRWIVFDFLLLEVGGKWGIMERRKWMEMGVVVQRPGNPGCGLHNPAARSVPVGRCNRMENVSLSGDSWNGVEFLGM